MVILWMRCYNVCETFILSNLLCKHVIIFMDYYKS